MPEIECLSQGLARSRRIARGGCGAALLEQRLELLQIEFARLEANCVARRSPLDPVCAKDGPQTGDVAVERALGGCRRSLAPDTVDQAIAGDDLVCLQKEHREHRPLLWPAQRRKGAVDPNLERAKDADVHKRRKPPLQRFIHIPATPSREPANWTYEAADLASKDFPFQEDLMNSSCIRLRGAQRLGWDAVPVRVTLCAGLAVAMVTVGLASAASSLNLGNGGDLHEGVGQADFKTMLARGSIYTANKFPVALKIHTPTPQWGGVQLESGKYRFIQLGHLRPPGTPPLTGVGYITLESATTATPSVSKTLANLRATPMLKEGPTKATRIAGLRARMFNATVTGDDGPGTGGLSIVPFTVNHHCGFCEQTLHRETKDLKVAGRGQLFRIIVLRAHGRTVVIYIESIYAIQKKHPPAKQFPTFLPYAQKMLAHISLS